MLFTQQGLWMVAGVTVLWQVTTQVLRKGVWLGAALTNMGR